MDRPIHVRHRPFAIEPITSMMMPDGIFDASIRFQEISFFVTNRSDYKLKFCWVRPDLSYSTDYVYSAAHMTRLGPMEPGESRLVRWMANFSACTPGKKVLRIEFGAQIDWDQLGGGFDGYFEKQIFVSKTVQTLDKNKFVCEVPEGKLQLQIQEYSLIGGWTYIDDDPDQPIEVIVPPFPVIEKIVGTVSPKPGAEDEIPFQDPWWKIVAWIVAALAAIGAFIAAKEGQGTASVGVSGDFDTDGGNSNWCIPDPTKHPDKENLAGYLSILATAAARVGMMDKRDPWQRGRDANPNDPSDPRVLETVEAAFQSPDSLQAGTKWEVPIAWYYQTSSSSGSVGTESKKEVGISENFASASNITLAPQINIGEDLVVTVYLEDGAGKPLIGDELYGFANFIAPNGHLFKRELRNTEFRSRKVLTEGSFQAGINTEWAGGQIGMDNARGAWKVELYGQLANRAPDNIAPFEAAKFVGGDFLLGPIEVKKINPDDDGKNPDAAKCQPDKFLETYVV